jgi:Histone methylation protein DOT1
MRLSLDQNSVMKNVVRKLTPKRIVAFCEPYVFDYIYRVSTRGVVDTVGSEVAGREDDNWYVGSQWLPVRRVLKKLHPHPSDVFVDIGSGKGKTLLIAGRLPFRRVVGVEIDEELSRWAKRNVQQTRPRLQVQEVDNITANALTWPIPDDVSVVFLFNPFTGRTFRTVARRIFESYDSKPRKLYIVYDHPLEHDWLLSTGRVVVDNVRCNYWPAYLGWWRDEQVIVSYRVIGISKLNQSELRLRRYHFRSRRAYRHWSSINAYHSA